MMNRLPTQIEISQQVWVCDACGCQDNKSCSCNSPAHAEMKAAKREATRQRVQRHREKSKEINDPVTGYTPVDNIKEFPKLRSDAGFATDNDVEWPDYETEIAPENRKNDFMLMASHAAVNAANYSGPIDEDVLYAARKAAVAWAQLVKTLEEKANGMETKS